MGVSQLFGRRKEPKEESRSLLTSKAESVEATAVANTLDFEEADNSSHYGTSGFLTRTEVCPIEVPRFKYPTVLSKILCAAQSHREMRS